MGIGDKVAFFSKPGYHLGRESILIKRMPFVWMGFQKAKAIRLAMRQSHFNAFASDLYTKKAATAIPIKTQVLMETGPLPLISILSKG